MWLLFIVVGVFDVSHGDVRISLEHNAAALPHILFNIPRNAVYVLTVVVTLFAGVAVGDRVLRLCRLPFVDALERIMFGLIAGNGCTILIAYAVASVGLLVPVVVWGSLIAGCAWTALAIPKWIRETPIICDRIRVSRTLVITMWIILGFGLYVCLLSALSPEVGFDARWYHLTEAKRFATHGGFYDLLASTRVWAFALPHYQESFLAFEWTIFGVFGAKLMSWADAILIVVALIAFSRTWFGTTAVGLFSAVVFFGTPVIAWSSTTGNNDLALAPLAVLGAHALLHWKRGAGSSVLIVAGLMCGIMYGIKPFGALFTVSVYVILTWCSLRVPEHRSGFIGAMAAFTGAFIVSASPAFLTAWSLTGDPFFPAATKLFTTRYGLAAAGDAADPHTTLFARLNPFELTSLLWKIVFEPTKYRDIVNPTWLLTLPIFLATPLLAKANRDVLRISLALVTLNALMFAVIAVLEFRYASYVLTLQALVIGYGLFCSDWASFKVVQKIAVGAILLLSVLGNELLVPIFKSSATGSVMGQAYLNWSYVYGGEEEREIQMQYVPMLEYVNAHLDKKNDRIYDAASLWLFEVYSDIELFNGVDFLSPGSLGEWSLYSPNALLNLEKARCTYVALAKSKYLRLSSAPIWSHLRFVTETASIDGPTERIDLYRVTK